MGEYQDVAHKDDMTRFAEYAYAVQTVQPGIPKSFYDAMKTPEASFWRAASDKEMDSLHELKVYSSFRALLFLRDRRSSTQSGF